MGGRSGAGLLLDNASSSRGRRRTCIVSRLKTCVRQRSSVVANHWPSELTAILVTVPISNLGFGLWSSEDSLASSVASSISTSSISTPSVPFRPLTTRLLIMTSRMRWCSNLRRTCGLPASVPRSRMMMYEDIAVATTSFFESGVKLKEDAPVEAEDPGSWL